MRTIDIIIHVIIVEFAIDKPNNVDLERTFQNLFQVPLDLPQTH